MKTILILLCLFPSAAFAKWEAQLCKYGEDGETRLIKIDEKNQRVLFNDLDANAVEITATNISFEPRDRVSSHWSLNRASGKVTVLKMSSALPVTILHGSCRQVEE